ncbi:molybdenum cofactor guanylyltransferase [Neisseria gonorrhoeae]
MKTSNFPKSPPALKTFALILAGGLADRMGGEDKGLALLEGRPLIDRVIGKIRPQVSHIVISANRNLEEYARRSPYVFPDARQWQHFGPLSALCTAANDLQLAAADWLLIVPCDMPYLPDDLVARFESVSKRTPLCNAFYVETPVTMHYNIMYIRPQILQSAIPYLFSGMKTLRSWLQQQRARPVRFEFDGHFADLNTQTDLQEG